MTTQHGITQPSLSAHDQAKLLALIASPIGEQTLAAVENARTEKRTAIVVALERVTAAANAEAQSKGQLAIKARETYQRARRALIEAEREVHQLALEASLASTRAEAATNRAMWDLLPLGNEAIQRARDAVRFAIRQTLAAARWLETRNAYGQVLVTEPNDELARVNRLKELDAELIALELSRMAPADIEKRCDATVKEAEKPRDKSFFSKALGRYV